MRAQSFSGSIGTGSPGMAVLAMRSSSLAVFWEDLVAHAPPPGLASSWWSAQVDFHDPMTAAYTPR